MGSPHCIESLTFTLVSSSMQARRLACEALTFLCYCDIPKGHTLVLESMDALQSWYHDTSRFDTWLRALSQMLDGRGKMGSMVGASDDYRKMGNTAADNQLMEYAVSIL